MIDRLEEEPRLLAAEPPEHRHGRDLIREQLPTDGHDPVTLRQRDERLAGGRQHYSSAASPDSPNERKKQEYAPVWHAPFPSCSTSKSSVSPSQS